MASGGITGGGLLAINTGSSSVKLAGYGNEGALTQLFRLSIDRVGQPDSQLRVVGLGHGETTAPVRVDGHSAAVSIALDHARESMRFSIGAVGHRIVHGGGEHTVPERITPSLIADLRQLIEIDPEHMPQALAAIDAIDREASGVPQVACFDTAFHRAMPEVARRYPLPGWVSTVGVRRYGFHGLSCEFVVDALARLDAAAHRGRLLIAHLGNGASITAVRNGIGVDTTMGFSPTSGLMMGTRSGDLDPTVLNYLGRTGRGDFDALQRLVSQQSGLLGVSGISGDMRDLLQQPQPAPAREAVELFCYIASKHIGALAAVLGGVDAMVFTGGIGEHAPPVRDRICSPLAYLGVQLDPTRNAANRDVISTADSRVVVRVMATDEELTIARHVRDVLA